MVNIGTRFFRSHLIKSFQQLKKGDIVYRPKINYIKPQYLQLTKYNYSESMDYGGYIYQFGNYSTALLDKNYNVVNDNYKCKVGVKGMTVAGTVPSFNRHKICSMSYRWTNELPVLNRETNQFEVKHRSEFNSGDIIKTHVVDELEGYLQLIEFQDNSNVPYDPNPLLKWLTKETNTTNAIIHRPEEMNNDRLKKYEEMQRKIHELEKQSFWYGTILDMNLKPFEATTYKGTNGYQEDAIMELKPKDKDYQETFLVYEDMYNKN